MRSFPSRGIAAVLATTLFVLLTACTSGRSAPTAADPGTGSATSAATPDATKDVAESTNCVDGRAAEDGQQGLIRVGPLASNRPFWRQTHGTKFWVASDRRQPPTAASIIAVSLSSRGDVVRVERTPLETAEVPNVALFFPGLIRLPEPGAWRITVAIGPDRACFLVLVD
ncbi:hypothetical protein [Micromonospora marina]|uniref:hypothetical protein n=1 Tax=Micromonospora marina TaxID=307120 RepID=UPI0034547CCF